MPSFGIVIPAYNESAQIQNCLTSLKPFLDHNDTIILSDACSTDDTTITARTFGINIITNGTQKRGAAVRHGVKKILETNRPDAIIIAHADMIFQPGSRTQLSDALNQHPDRVGGYFGHKIDSPKWIFRIVERGNALRASWLHLPYGDQAQFFRPALLEGVGGFPENDTLEDFELALRMKKAGRLINLNCPVTIPPRHWRNGVINTTLRNWMTVIRYLARGKQFT